MPGPLSPQHGQGTGTDSRREGRHERQKCSRERALPAAASVQRPAQCCLWEQAAGGHRAPSCGGLGVWEQSQTESSGWVVRLCLGDMWSPELAQTLFPRLLLELLDMSPVCCTPPAPFLPCAPVTCLSFALVPKDTHYRCQTPEGCPRSRLASHDTPIRAGDTG